MLLCVYEYVRKRVYNHEDPQSTVIIGNNHNAVELIAPPYPKTNRTINKKECGDVLSSTNVMAITSLYGVKLHLSTLNDSINELTKRTDEIAGKVDKLTSRLDSRIN